MKKFAATFLVLAMLFTMPVAKAETLDQFVAKAEAALKAQKEASSKKSMSEEERKTAVAQKEKVTKEVIDIDNQTVQLKKDIENLKEEIKRKDKEIKEIMKFVQVSEGQSAYLDYAFGASSFTDFIYRVSVAEQLSNYNDDLIKGYNKDIKTIEQKQKELAIKQNELKSKQKELEVLIDKLAKEIKEYNGDVQTYQAEYDNLMKYVSELRKLNCRGNEDMKACQARLFPPPSKPSGGGGGNIGSYGPFTGYYMPLDKGRVTSNYGPRSGGFHNGMDISNYEGAPVYPLATGVVIAVSTGQSCGRNIVYIIHNIEGTYYTTVYYHLKSVSVSFGQSVSHTTQIGTQGGNPSYDSCTTGSHIDIKLFKGRYLTDFFSLGSGHQNPRNWLTQAPPQGSYFNQR